MDELGWVRGECKPQSAAGTQKVYSKKRQLAIDIIIDTVMKNPAFHDQLPKDALELHFLDFGDPGIPQLWKTESSLIWH